MEEEIAPRAVYKRTVIQLQEMPIATGVVNRSTMKSLITGPRLAFKANRSLAATE